MNGVCFSSGLKLQLNVKRGQGDMLKTHEKSRRSEADINLGLHGSALQRWPWLNCLRTICSASALLQPQASSH